MANFKLQQLYLSVLRDQNTKSLSSKLMKSITQFEKNQCTDMYWHNFNLYECHFLCAKCEGCWFGFTKICFHNQCKELFLFLLNIATKTNALRRSLAQVYVSVAILKYWICSILHLVLSWIFLYQVFLDQLFSCSTLEYSRAKGLCALFLKYLFYNDDQEILHLKKINENKHHCYYTFTWWVQI